MRSGPIKAEVPGEGEKFSRGETRLDLSRPLFLRLVFCASFSPLSVGRDSAACICESRDILAVFSQPRSRLGDDNEGGSVIPVHERNHQPEDLSKL